MRSAVSKLPLHLTVIEVWMERNDKPNRSQLKHLFTATYDESQIQKIRTVVGKGGARRLTHKVQERQQAVVSLPANKMLRHWSLRTFGLRVSRTSASRKI